MPQQGQAERYLWCLTVSFAYFSPFIGYAARCAPQVRAWDAYTTDWTLPPEAEGAWYREKQQQPPTLRQHVDDAVAAWEYPTLYTTAGLVVHPLSLAAGRSLQLQSPGWRKLDAYLRRYIPAHLHRDLIKADGRYTNPHGMYITCLIRMLPLFGFVWWTKRKVWCRGREAMEKYRSL